MESHQAHILYLGCDSEKASLQGLSTGPVEAGPLAPVLHGHVPEEEGCRSPCRRAGPTITASPDTPFPVLAPSVVFSTPLPPDSTGDQDFRAHHDASTGRLLKIL